MTKFFLIKGSAKEPYKVAITKDGNNLTAHCSCPAGVNGMHCKHRINLFHGIKKGIVSTNLEEVEEVVSWLEGTDVSEAISTVINLEKEVARIRKELIKAKKTLAQVMRR